MFQVFCTEELSTEHPPDPLPSHNRHKITPYYTTSFNKLEQNQTTAVQKIAWTMALAVLTLTAWREFIIRLTDN